MAVLYGFIICHVPWSIQFHSDLYGHVARVGGETPMGMKNSRHDQINPYLGLDRMM